MDMPRHATTGDEQHVEGNDSENPLGLVWGAEGTAPIIGRSVRQARYLLKSGAIPSRRVGRFHVTTMREITAALLGPSQPNEAA